MHRWTRRTLLCGALALAAGTAQANPPPPYPTRPVELVVAFPPGGVTDIAARLFAKSLGDVLGQPVVVDNRPGAGGRLGSEYAARAKPDGHVLLFANTPTHGTLSASSQALRYDPQKSFTGIAPLFWYSAVMVCNPQLPARSVSELVAWARKRPDGLVYASAGIGSGVNFSGEWFGTLAKVKVKHVPYRGSAPALQAVMAGEVDCTFDGAAQGQIAAGKVRALATTGVRRDPFYPELPTLDELGLKGFDMVLWQGLMAPAGLPEPVAERLRDATAKALRDPALIEGLKAHRLSVLGGDAGDLSRLVAAEVGKYRRLAQEYRIEFE